MFGSNLITKLGGAISDIELKITDKSF